MTEVERIVGHCRAAARMLAVVAVTMFVLGAHPWHAAADATDRHQAAGHPGLGAGGLFGASCPLAELEPSGVAAKGFGHPGHADCTQAFGPLQPPPAGRAPDDVISVEMAPRDLPCHGFATACDPPPPRQV